MMTHIPPFPHPRLGNQGADFSPALHCLNSPAARAAQSGAFSRPDDREKRARWTRAITSALSAVRQLGWGLGYRGFVPPSLSISAATFGHVASIETQARPARPQPSDWEARLHARAVMVCNRNPKAVARYLETHRALKALCSEGARNG